MARRPPIPQRKNTNFADAYEWVADMRDYTRRIKDGPVKATDLAGQAHINEIAQRVEKALDDLGRVLPGGRVDRVYVDLTAPLRTYLSLVVVPRALWAEPKAQTMLRLKNNPAARRTSRGPRRDASGRFVKLFEPF